MENDKTVTVRVSAENKDVLNQYIADQEDVYAYVQKSNILLNKSQGFHVFLHINPNFKNAKPLDFGVSLRE